MSCLIDRYSFIPLSAWQSVKHIFPHAVSYGNSKVVSYDSPKASAEMMALVESSGLELVHYSQTNSKMIIDAINDGIDKIYNCEHSIALEVSNYFSEDVRNDNAN